MRRHKTLENMVEVARNNGESTRKGWHVTYDRYATGNLKDIYPRYNVEETTDILTIIHWGTPILEIHNTSYRLGESNYSHVILHGESKSDSDAINAMLSYHGIDDIRTTFRPVNGGFIILDMSENISQIQSDMCKHASENIRKNAPWILS